MLNQTEYGTFEYELAKRWAPVHWQETHAGGQWRSDLLTAVNFDGDWKTIGNWNAMGHHPLLPVVYFSVVESRTHWFALYAFYHPRDWTASGLALDQHENDMEGLLAVVEKPGALAAELPHGQLVGLITIAHNHFYSYSNALTGNRESLDGRLFFTAGGLDGQLHPCTRQEDEGHGCFALQPTDSRVWAGLGRPLEIDDGVARAAFEFPHSSGIRYFHGGQAAEPTGRGKVCDHDFTYVLVDIFEAGGLWDRRCAALNEPYTVENRFAGREFEDDKASPPWMWDDKDDASSLGAGIMATDPARLVWDYFGGLGEFSNTYVSNPYTRPLDCGGDVDRRVFSLRGLTSTARATGVEASQADLRRQLRLALDPAARQDVGASLVRRADRSEPFRRRLVSAARETVKAALEPGRIARGPDASQRAHLSIPAIHVLGRYEDKDSRSMLVDLIASSTDRDVLVAALAALRELDPGREAGLKSALERLLRHGDHEVRLRAALLYGETLARRYPEPLAALVGDPNSDVRAAVLTGLGRSRRPEDRALLGAAAADHAESPNVRAAAVRAQAREERSPVRPARRGRRQGMLATAAPGARLTASPVSSDDYARFALAKASRE